jgi:RNA polymerase sigma-70 factor (ECF subfamily)
MATMDDIPRARMLEQLALSATDLVASAVDAEAGQLRLAHVLSRDFELVWRTLRRLGVPEADVDDGAQLVFMTLSSRLEDVESGRERAFLLGTCTRVAANQRRKVARRPEVLDAEPDRRSADLPNPEEAMLTKQRRALLDEGLDELPPDQRAVFVLFELEGFSLPEIAESLAIPLGTATSRLRRARLKFEAWVCARHTAQGESR